MTQDTKEVNMEDRSEKPSGFLRIPSVWKMIRTIAVMIFAIWGLLWGLPAIFIWWGTGPAVKTTAEEARDDPKVFGGGAPGR